MFKYALRNYLVCVFLNTSVFESRFCIWFYKTFSLAALTIEPINKILMCKNWYYSKTTIVFNYISRLETLNGEISWILPIVENYKQPNLMDVKKRFKNTKLVKVSVKNHIDLTSETLIQVFITIKVIFFMIIS